MLYFYVQPCVGNSRASVILINVLIPGLIMTLVFFFFFFYSFFYFPEFSFPYAD